MVNRSSKEPPTVTSRATIPPSRTSHATETTPRWRNEARPRRARTVLMGLRGSVGGGGTQQEEEGGALQVGGGAVAGGGLRRPAAEDLADDDAVVQGQDDARQAVRRQRQPDADAGGRGVDERGQPVVQLLGVPPQEGRRLGVPGGVQRVLRVHEDPGAVGAEGGQAPLDRGGDRVVLVLQPDELLLGPGEVAGGLPLEQRREQLVLGTEAGVEGPAGEPPAPADVLDARGGEADLGERLEGGVQQPLDSFGAAPLGPLHLRRRRHDAALYWIHGRIERSRGGYGQNRPCLWTTNRAGRHPRQARPCRTCSPVAGTTLGTPAFKLPAGRSSGSARPISVTSTPSSSAFARPSGGRYG